jgi:hypothetical protein
VLRKSFQAVCEHGCERMPDMSDGPEAIFDSLRAQYETELRLLGVAQHQLARYRSSSDEMSQGVYRDSVLQHIKLLRSANDEARHLLADALRQVTQSP